MNSASHRLSFVNKIGIILKATSDDENPTPGYMFKEIKEISFESAGFSESLAEFLTDRLRQKSCNVKFKALKVIKHLTENGSKEFLTAIRKYSDVIKECTKFGGLPHPMHGNAPYLSVRKISKELCEVLYNNDAVAVQSPDNLTAPERPVAFKYGGLGPVQSKGSLQGFGNTPINQTRGIEDFILDGIEKIGAKITETAADRQAALLAKLDLGSSTSNYKPPVVGVPVEQLSPFSPPESLKPVGPPIQTRSVKKHQPGKAGGGWGDEDDSDNDENGRGADSNSYQPSMETDSLFDPSVRLQPEADWQEETDFVTKVLKQGSTGTDSIYLSPSDVTAFLARCSSLSCDTVVEILVSKLASQDAGVVLRALQCLEGILYNREELISVDTLAAVCKEALATCYNSCQERLQVSQTVRQNDQSQSPWSCVRVKVAKLALILQQLSAHKDILPATKLAELTNTSAVSSMTPVTSS